MPRLQEAIRRAKHIAPAVAFIKSSGLSLIYGVLEDAYGVLEDAYGVLEDAVVIRGAHLRVPTSDYFDVTDPRRCAA